MNKNVFSNLDDNSIDKIAKECPMFSDEYKEKIYRDSLRKSGVFGDTDSITKADEVHGVEVKTAPVWKKYFSIAASVVIVGAAVTATALCFGKMNTSRPDSHDITAEISTDVTVTAETTTGETETTTELTNVEAETRGADITFKEEVFADNIDTTKLLQDYIEVSEGSDGMPDILSGTYSDTEFTLSVVDRNNEIIKTIADIPVNDETVTAASYKSDGILYVSYNIRRLMHDTVDSENDTSCTANYIIGYNSDYEECFRLDLDNNIIFGYQIFVKNKKLYIWNNEGDAASVYVYKNIGNTAEKISKISCTDNITNIYSIFADGNGNIYATGGSDYDQCVLNIEDDKTMVSSGFMYDGFFPIYNDDKYCYGFTYGETSPTTLYKLTKDGTIEEIGSAESVNCLVPSYDKEYIGYDHNWGITEDGSREKLFDFDEDHYGQIIASLGNHELLISSTAFGIGMSQIHKITYSYNEE